MSVQQELLIKVGRWGKGSGVHVRLIAGNELLCPLGGRTDGHAFLDGLCCPVGSAVGEPPHDSGEVGSSATSSVNLEGDEVRGFCFWFIGTLVRLKGRATVGEKEEQAAGQCAPQIMLVPSVQKHMPTARAMALPE